MNTPEQSEQSRCVICWHKIDKTKSGWDKTDRGLVHAACWQRGKPEQFQNSPVPVIDWFITLTKERNGLNDHVSGLDEEIARLREALERIAQAELDEEGADYLAGLAQQALEPDK